MPPELNDILGGVYAAAGFVGAFVSETGWWRRRVKVGSFPMGLRIVFFLLLVRGIMRLAPSPALMAAGIAAVMAAGFGLIWWDFTRGRSRR